ncbi:hypothetical protein SAMD00019534_053130 [Acytostelium subglobosum LB1]|uniref:hypothetical protein n=1 Tax=Acytostelium subglobosum LB1 TaxID=1410327 RepID=UPI000644E8C7|nr:hypothetical protein SAMD00019534_053130 [Acytostelium subglobosum LB1]GAM22138.1 hypothetical protein SAMD00019534_053130 [Acytostelium subglobosum LB1]|eukprot:XP_012755238.1 hypothetical protein SAMD00019534_053130 [Acytostelium subglobosum LB1]
MSEVSNNDDNSDDVVMSTTTSTTDNIDNSTQQHEQEEEEHKPSSDDMMDTSTTTTTTTATTNNDSNDINNNNDMTTSMNDDVIMNTTSTSTTTTTTTSSSTDINNDSATTNTNNLGTSTAGTTTKFASKTLSHLTQQPQQQQQNDDGNQQPTNLVSNKDDIDITQTNLDEPRDSRVIKNILKTMGVQSHDPRVVNQLLEFMFKYVYEVLQDSIAYSEHSGRSEIDISDIRLSIQSRVNFSFTQPPPRELLLSISEEKNRIPLPPIPQKFGVLLPPDEYCLNYPNYQVDPAKPKPAQHQAPLSHPSQRGQYNKTVAEKQIPIRLQQPLQPQPQPSVVAPPPMTIAPPSANGKHD